MQVSIQLMSPASGDAQRNYEKSEKGKAVSIQLMSPASGDVVPPSWRGFSWSSLGVSIQLMSPASGDQT